MAVPVRLRRLSPSCAPRAKSTRSPPPLCRVLEPLVRMVIRPSLTPPKALGSGAWDRIGVDSATKVGCLGGCDDSTVLSLAQPSLNIRARPSWIQTASCSLPRYSAKRQKLIINTHINHYMSVLCLRSLLMALFSHNALTGHRRRAPLLPWR